MQTIIGYEGNKSPCNIHRGQKADSLVELSVRTPEVTWELRKKELEETSNAEMEKLSSQRELLV